MNKKVKYAIRMYEFHSRLLNKYLNIIQEHLEKNKLIEIKTNKPDEVANGQISIFEVGREEK